jgi:hypothetical protein
MTDRPYPDRGGWIERRWIEHGGKVGISSAAFTTAHLVKAA